MYKVLLPVGHDVKRTKQTTNITSNLPQASDELDVVILHVIKEFDAIDSGGIVESEDLLEDYNVPESIEMVEQRLEDHDIEHTTRLEHGDIENTIVDVAEEIDADMITMGGRKRSPTGKAIFGSTTQNILLQSKVPVFVAVN